jgi:hypothetical protein
MLTEKFDAYGEAFPDAARATGEAATNTPAVLSRIGQFVFWLLVVIIVSARIIYYPATPAFDVGSASELQHTATR